MKGYIEIPAVRVIDAVNNYDAKIIEDKKTFDSIKKRLEGIIYKGWFSSETEWDRCHESCLGFPDFKYIKANHPDIHPIYMFDWYGEKEDTDKIRALGLEGVFENVLCDEDLALFVMDYA